MSVLKRHWFLFGLLVSIPAAASLAQADLPQSVVDGILSVPTSYCTASILFLMAVTLDSGRLLNSVRRPMPAVLSCGVNQIVLPLLCLPLLAFQKSADLKVGLLIAASVPSTMAAASVWTRRAGGNDAVSLLVTLLTNGLCFVVTPIWMSVGSRWFATTDTSAGLGFQGMVVRLTLAALVPAVIGQVLRGSVPVRSFVDRNKPTFSTVAQLIILLLVAVSSFKGGQHFTSGNMADNLRHAEFATVWACCIGLHLAAMLILWTTSGTLKIAEEDRRACVFAGSQKTLPIGILVSQATGLPFSLLPILMYHASQLFIDTWVADRLKLRPDSQPKA